MRSLTENLATVRNALLTVTDKVYHFEHPQGESRFIVWQESSEVGSLKLNDRKAEQQIEGTIDLYTRTELDPWIDEIQEALEAVSRLTWELSSVDYEDDTGLTHYEWTFTVA